jgi:hypothetical protein
MCFHLPEWCVCAPIHIFPSKSSTSVLVNSELKVSWVPGVNRLPAPSPNALPAPLHAWHPMHRWSTPYTLLYNIYAICDTSGVYWYSVYVACWLCSAGWAVGARACAVPYPAAILYA